MSGLTLGFTGEIGVKCSDESLTVSIIPPSNRFTPLFYFCANIGPIGRTGFLLLFQQAQTLSDHLAG